ncbi:hypothetical protein VTL71DRAFT_16475 [Oculimacula yallundae]|uniref:Uncharacterized protein n=1 Tax=Oculimacula yallundae TaxID=86028 RepID=A0ABR4CEJ6_9HELO
MQSQPTSQTASKSRQARGVLTVESHLKHRQPSLEFREAPGRTELPFRSLAAPDHQARGVEARIRDVFDFASDAPNSRSVLPSTPSVHRASNAAGNRQKQKSVQVLIFHPFRKRIPVNTAYSLTAFPFACLHFQKTMTSRIPLASPFFSISRHVKLRRAESQLSRLRGRATDQ